MKKLAILSIISPLAPAFAAGAVETVQRRHVSIRGQKTHLTRPEPPAIRLSPPVDSYRA